MRGCFRCDYTDHKARDPNCPARSKKCNACGEIGHFAVCCKTKERKPLTRDDEGRNNTGGRAYQLSEDSNKIIMHLQLESVSLQVVVKLI